MRPHARALLSGGLDGSPAGKIILDQGIDACDAETEQMAAEILAAFSRDEKAVHPVGKRIPAAAEFLLPARKKFPGKRLRVFSLPAPSHSLQRAKPDEYGQGQAL